MKNLLYCFYFICLSFLFSQVTFGSQHSKSTQLNFSSWSECNFTAAGDCKLLSQMLNLTYLDWANEDLKMIKEDLSTLNAYPNFQKIMNLLFESTDTKVEFIPVVAPSFIASALYHDSRYLIFINKAKYRDSFQKKHFNVRHSTYVLLHELFHHYMYEKTIGYNPSSIFFSSLISVTGWKSTRQPHPQVISQYLMARQYRGIIIDDLEAELNFDKEFSQRHGFPTYYSMSNLKEYFAEIATHATLDEKSLIQYLPESITDWLIKQNLLQ